MMHTHVKQILELIDDRIALSINGLEKFNPGSIEFQRHFGAYDELHYIKNDIEQMFGE